MNSLQYITSKYHMLCVPNLDNATAFKLQVSEMLRLTDCALMIKRCIPEIAKCNAFTGSYNKCIQGHQYCKHYGTDNIVS